jgi:hypothetical protein
LISSAILRLHVIRPCSVVAGRVVASKPAICAATGACIRPIACRRPTIIISRTISSWSAAAVVIHAAIVVVIPRDLVIVSAGIVVVPSTIIVVSADVVIVPSDIVVIPSAIVVRIHTLHARARPVVPADIIPRAQIPGVRAAGPVVIS